MLPLLHNIKRNIPKILTTFVKVPITTTKNLADKKKKLYGSQVG